MAAEAALHQRQRRWRLVYASMCGARQEGALPTDIATLEDRCAVLLLHSSRPQEAVDLALPVQAAIRDLVRFGVVSEGPGGEFDLVDTATALRNLEVALEERVQAPPTL
mmetsp:Transcript_20969/g.42262  ORF Transcript_20969/g.42262 Transcript_20969/m.42262 type:complete len:109 (+) Transcript_20969:187-513(+)